MRPDYSHVGGRGGGGGAKRHVRIRGDAAAIQLRVNLSVLQPACLAPPWFPTPQPLTNMLQIPSDYARLLSMSALLSLLSDLSSPPLPSPPLPSYPRCCRRWRCWRPPCRWTAVRHSPYCATSPPCCTTSPSTQPYRWVAGAPQGSALGVFVTPYFRL